MGTKLETLVADIADRFAAAIGVTIPMVVGERKRHAHASPPAIYWTPTTGGAINPPQLSGRQGGQSRELASKATAVNVDIWATTPEQAERLHEALIALFVNEARWCFPLGDFHWVSEDEGEAGFTEPTGLIRQAIKVLTPIMDKGHDLRTVITLPTYQSPPVDTVGTSPGVNPIFEIVAPGLLGVATFRWSTDSGATWHGPLATGDSVALGSTGLAVSFAAGAYQAGAVPPPPTFRSPLMVTIRHVATTPGTLTHA